MITNREFIEMGYLQEANRQFFHPLGLALAVSTGSLDDPVNITVLDSRTDPEGIYFDEADDLSSKANHIAEIATRRLTPRSKALGYWIQGVA